MNLRLSLYVQADAPHAVNAPGKGVAGQVFIGAAPLSCLA